MNAAHPLIRLEAAYIMAQKKAPRAYAYAESLMYRFEGLLTPLFAQFFAMIGTLGSDSHAAQIDDKFR